MSELNDKVRRAVYELTRQTGKKDVYHPELGWVIKDGKATRALLAFFKKLDRKTSSGPEPDKPTTT
jgi:hypothetical protein